MNGSLSTHTEGEQSTVRSAHQRSPRFLSCGIVLFSSAELSSIIPGLVLSSANSINWGRQQHPTRSSHYTRVRYAHCSLSLLPLLLHVPLSGRFLPQIVFTFASYTRLVEVKSSSTTQPSFRFSFPAPCNDRAAPPSSGAILCNVGFSADLLCALLLAV